MANSSDYRLGSIWLVTFDLSKGTEIRKTRPALIVSGTLFNQQRSKVTVLPFTSVKPNDSRISPAVTIVPASKENGLAVDSLLVCVDPMTFDKSRLIKRLGDLETELLQQAIEQVESMQSIYICEFETIKFGLSGMERKMV